MGLSKHADGPSGTRIPTANELWKGRWSVWVGRSTVAAIFAHVILFVVWPDLILSVPERDTVMEVIQLDPVLTYGAPTDDGDGTPTPMPNADEILQTLDSGEDGAEIEETISEEEALGAFIAARTSEPIIPLVTERTVEPSSFAPAADLILDRLAAISPRVASTINVDFPRIRNPTRIMRYLAIRYNPHHDTPGMRGSVSVSMTVNTRGSVEWAAVSESSGQPMLDQIALDLFNDVASFSPARSDGARVPMTMVISVPFDTRW